MPKIQIAQTHQLPLSQVKTYIDQLSRDLGAKYDLKSSWISDTEAKVERSGVSGSIKLEPTQVTIHLDLSFALTPVKGMIESKIRDELKKLGTPANIG